MDALLEIIDVSRAEVDRDGLFGQHLDSPRLGNRIDARGVPFVGWTLPRAGPAPAVELVNGSGPPFRHVPLEDPRPDVAAAFEDVPYAASGFRTLVNLMGATGELEVGVRAVLPDHQRVDIARIRARPLWRGTPAGHVLVSVVVTCHNQAQFLAEAIESVLAQTYPWIEVIVIDDGSGDNSAEVAARYPGVKVVPQTNRGLAAARNRGLLESTGEYVVFLDADDRLRAHAAEVAVVQLQKHPDCPFVAGRFQPLSSDGSRLAPYSVEANGAEHYLTLLTKNHISMHATVTYRRGFLVGEGGFNTRLAACEDYELYLRLARRLQIHVFDDVVAEYRIHAQSMSTDPALMLRSSVTALRSQRWHTARSRRYRRAYRAGQRGWRELYGRQLAANIRAGNASGRSVATVADLATLARYYPRALAQLAPLPRAAAVAAPLRRVRETLVARRRRSTRGAWP
jgi:GT2 family glycosyltransferase